MNKLIYLLVMFLTACGGGGEGYTAPVKQDRNEYEICVEINIEHLYGTPVTLGELFITIDGVKNIFDGVNGGSYIYDSQSNVALDFSLNGSYFDFNINAEKYNYFKIDLLDQGGYHFGAPELVAGNRDIAECW